MQPLLRPTKTLNRLLRSKSDNLHNLLKPCSLQSSVRQNSTTCPRVPFAIPATPHSIGLLEAMTRTSPRSRLPVPV